MVKYTQEKSAANLKIPVTADTFHFIAAKLEISVEQLAFSLGYKNLNTYLHDGKRKKDDRIITGARALCLTYFVALYGYDVRDLLVEAEEAVHIKRAVEITAFNYKATLAYLRMVGAEPLTKDPIYIRRSDLALLVNPNLKHLRDIFNENPLRLWRGGKKMRNFEASRNLSLTSQRYVQLESGTGESSTLQEAVTLQLVVGGHICEDLARWLQRLRAARYELAAPSSTQKRK